MSLSSEDDLKEGTEARHTNVEKQQSHRRQVEGQKECEAAAPPKRKDISMS